MRLFGSNTKSLADVFYQPTLNQYQLRTDQTETGQFKDQFVRLTILECALIEVKSRLLLVIKFPRMYHFRLIFLLSIYLRI